MSIPNYENIIVDTKNRYPRAWQHCHVEGDPERKDFIILAARAVYLIDSRFGCNGKRGNVNDLSMDALNWIGTPADPTNVIDCVAGAGGPNPSPTWQVTNSTGAFVNPNSVNTYYNYGNNPGPIEPPKPTFPSYESIGGDPAGNKIGLYLFHDYIRAGQYPNPGMGVWFYRTCYDSMAGMGVDASITKHRAEWCAILGVPVDNWVP